MFTTKDFPGRKFNTLAEYEEARRLKQAVETRMAERAAAVEKPATVIATIIPAEPGILERRMLDLEARLKALEEHAPIGEEPTADSLQVGAILRGESKGRHFTLEVLADKFLCSDGRVYPTLSAAALGVSGNRRSGWKFWKDASGKPIGETTGRFRSV